MFDYLKTRPDLFDIPNFQFHLVVFIFMAHRQPWLRDHHKVFFPFPKKGLLKDFSRADVDIISRLWDALSFFLDSGRNDMIKPLKL